MKSQLVGLRFLIIPTNVSPPSIGNPAIYLFPGPPPQIRLYTGLAAELSPATIEGGVFGGIPSLILTGPDTSDTTLGPATMKFGVDNGADPEAFIEITTEDLAVLDNSLGTELLKLHGGASFANPTVPFAEIVRFRSGSTSMQQILDFEGTDINAVSPTVYTTPSTICGVTFRAPPSGRGIIHWRGRFDFNFSAASPINRIVRCCPALRTGASIGSGTDPNLVEGQATPNDDIGCGHSLTHPTGTGSLGAPAQSGAALVSGLTFNDQYNVFLRTRCNSATTFNYDILAQMIGWLPLY